MGTGNSTLSALCVAVPEYRAVRQRCCTEWAMAWPMSQYAWIQETLAGHAVAGIRHAYIGQIPAARNDRARSERQGGTGRTDRAKRSNQRATRGTGFTAGRASRTARGTVVCDAKGGRGPAASAARCMYPSIARASEPVSQNGPTRGLHVAPVDIMHVGEMRVRVARPTPRPRSPPERVAASARDAPPGISMCLGKRNTQDRVDHICHQHELNDELHDDLQPAPPNICSIPARRAHRTRVRFIPRYCNRSNSLLTICKKHCILNSVHSPAQGTRDSDATPRLAHRPANSPLPRNRGCMAGRTTRATRPDAGTGTGSACHCNPCAMGPHLAGHRRHCPRSCWHMERTARRHIDRRIQERCSGWYLRFRRH